MIKFCPLGLILLILASSRSLLAAPDYAAIKQVIGMSENEVKERLGAPDKAMDALADHNSVGTWIYRGVIHPDSGKAVSCFLYFRASGVVKVVCS